MCICANDCKGVGAQGLTVEISPEGDELLLAGGSSCASQTCFNSGCTGIVELEARKTAAGDLVKLFNKLHLYLCGKVVAVHKLLCLLGADLRMAVTETGYIYTGGKVDIGVAVNVGKCVAEAGFKCYGEQSYLAGISLHVLCASCVILLRLGAGYLSGYKMGDGSGIYACPVLTHLCITSFQK